MTQLQKTTETHINAPDDFDFDSAWRKAQAVAKSGMFGLSKPEDVLTIMMAGHDLGFSATAAIRAVHIIKGRPFLSADAMVAVVLRSGNAVYFEPRELTEKSCTYVTRRKGSPNEVSLTFTLDDAKRAGLLSNDNWNKWPKDMLRARAASKLARMVYPDAVLGVYVAGEEADFEAPTAREIRSQDIDAAIMGDVVDVEVVE